MSAVQPARALEVLHAFGAVLFDAAVELVVADEARRRRFAVVKINVCANGKAGYSLEGKGESYAVKDPCKSAPRTGHIFCEACRKEAGGYGR